MSRPLAYALMVAGIIVMVAASLWAPPQPELWQGRSACEVASCGTLEDPARWRAAWWLWAAGFTMLVIAVPFVSRPLRLRPLWVAVIVVTAPAWLLGFAVVAYWVSLVTSVQGAAAVGACGVVGPLLAVLLGGVRSRHSDPVRERPSAPQGEADVAPR